MLIIEEIPDHRPSVFESYVGFCKILGFDYRVCHRLKEAFLVQKIFEPDMIIWIMHTNNQNNIELFRSQNKDLKIVTASDIKDFFHPAKIQSVKHYHFPSSLVSLWEFQDMISEFWGEQNNFIPPPPSSADD